MGTSFADSVKAIMAGNLVISLLFAGALQYLWGMVNSLQVMVMAILFGVYLPENLQVILIAVTKACSFDFYKTEDLYDYLFQFKETPSFSETFEAADIEGSNFVISIGPMFLFIVYFFGWILLKAFVRRCCGPCCKCCKCYQRIFNSESKSLPTFITFLLESCVDIGLSSCVSISLMDDERFSTAAEAMSSTLAYWFAVALVVAPIYLIISGCRLHKAHLAKNSTEVERY
mmetsp:Transcript_33742/g.44510  ORF Transcript_33742/g.44510 Transcript_33742/m.44510 type:complete len:230 (+) Transcript_33742:313-1002(+)